MTLLIDVREADEYAAGHAPGAIHLPLLALVCDNLGVLADTEKSETIELYCRSGNRSERAREILVGKGFTNVINLGGLKDVGLEES